MIKTISTAEVRQSLGDLLNRVDLRQDEFIIERKGKALAAMVPVAKLEQMREAARLQLEQILNTRKKSPAQRETDQLAHAAKHASRRNR